MKKWLVILALALFILPGTAQAISFQEIFTKGKGMPPAEYAQYKKSFIGKKVVWSGEIYEVDYDLLRKLYMVHIQMIHAGWSVEFFVPKEVANKLKAGLYCQFSGIILDSYLFVGKYPTVNLTNVKILNLE